MNDTRQDDKELVTAFDALRRETAAGLAPFRLARRTPRRALRWHARPILVSGLLAAVAVGAVLERRAVERRAMLAPFLSSTTWRSPTDYLLVTPGQELLSTVPSVGTTAGGTSTMTDTVSGTPQ
jgi:hypothetical protein